VVFSSRLKRLEAAMREAESYAEWKQAALAHDEESGAQDWKTVDDSEHYDNASIRARLDHLRSCRERQDDSSLLFALNEGIHGNMGGMGSSALYERAKVGTKHLITKLDFFRRASHCFGRSALMLSGSGTLLFIHLGVVRALWQEGLLPDIISGSSGGSIVGSIMCASTDEELHKIFDPGHIPGKDAPESWFEHIVSAIKPDRITREDTWNVLEKLLPDFTFQEAFEHTGRHMNISVAPAEMLQKSRLLNADTSPNVFMREAVLASTAIPGFFPPVVLMAKNDKGERQEYHGSRKWVDGSISDDLPAKRLARLYGVNHYIVSQTNPLVIPFIDHRERKSDPLSALKHATVTSAKTWFNAGVTMLNKPLSIVPEAKRLTSTLLAVINQSYVGDITIMPLTKWHNPLKALSWRTEEEIIELMDEGERATWPHIERVRIQTRISRTLDPILHRYEDLHVEHYGKPGKARKTRGGPRIRRKAS
jgi:NTE family protein